MTERRGILQVLFGPEAFRKQAVEPGQRLVVGRDERAQMCMHRDRELGPRHLDLLWDGIVAQIRALGSGGISIDGRPALRGELRSGGTLAAGQTTWRFFVEDHTAPSPAEPCDLEPVLGTLRPCWQRGHLYAVVDAARSRRILTLLQEAVDPHASLYEGVQGRALDAVAPYLVHLRADSGLLERLLREGWGAAWGIFLAGSAGPREVRRALRRLLVTEVEITGERLYFRYYDPRVLGAFAPLWTVRQRSELLAGIDAYWFEGPDGAVGTLAEAG